MTARIAAVIVDHRRLLVLLMAVLAVGFGVLIPRVSVNTDMTKYLPSDSPMRQGTSVMEEQLGTDAEASTIRVMVDGFADDAVRAAVRDDLAAVDGVASVATGDWDAAGTDGSAAGGPGSSGAERARYVSGEHTLYVLTVDAGYDSDAYAKVEDAVSDMARTGIEGHATTWGSDNPSTASELPLWIVAVAIGLLAVILLAMCASWVEPVLFLLTIGMAVAINIGSTALQGEVSEVTFSIAAILQLVLSMDYSIILANRYRQERAAQRDAGTAGEEGATVAAMKAALAHSFGAVASASLTTVVGLLMLLFMSFRIGADLGVVLAKGVAISLVCVLTVLPGLILAFDRWIEASAKPYLEPRLGGLARFEYRFRWALALLFVVVLAGSFVLQGRTVTAYTLSRDDPVGEVFAKDNQVVLVYPNADEKAAAAIASQLTSNPRVRSVQGYSTTIGEQLTVEEMTTALASLETKGGSAVGLDADTLRLVYTDAEGGGTGTMSVSELGAFLQEQQASGQGSGTSLSDALSESDAAALAGLSQLEQAAAAGAVDPALLTRQMTPAEMSAALAGVGQPVSEAGLGLILLARAAATSYDDSWTMSIDELIAHLTGPMSSDARFTRLLDTDRRAQLATAQEEVDAVRAELVGSEDSRLIITTDLPEESDATLDFVSSLASSADSGMTGGYWLIGNSVMVSEMEGGFAAENLRITLLTAGAIFFIVALTFRSAAVPALLVLLVQCGVFITVSVIGLQGYAIYYLAMLVVQCILMGATIDYAIVLTSYYRQHRRAEGVAEALAGAYEGSIHTVLTSGLIMIIVTGVLGYLFENPTVGQICRTISIGATAAVLLIVLVLPALLAVTDRWIVPRGQRLVPGVQEGAGAR